MTDDILSCKDLIIWQKAMALAEATYALTEHLPKSETYGLISQIRRSVVSIPSNIAEGHARDSTREYLRFLSIAAGSLAELETQLALCEKLHLLEPRQIESSLRTATELGKQIRVLRHSLIARIEVHQSARNEEAEYRVMQD